jgi:protein-S-isoprenylcysteine O-methyltransferase Ste14
MSVGSYTLARPMADDPPHRPEPPPSPRLPRSATHYGLNLVAVVAVLATIAALHGRQHLLQGNWLQNCVLALCGAAIVPVVLLDVLVLKVHRRESTGLDWDKFDPSPARVATKVLGFVVTIAPIALVYWWTPEYNGTFYDPLYGLLRRFWAPLVVGVPAYMWIVDGYMRAPKDAYWQLGRVALLRAGDAEPKEIANHYRGWLVKGFFLPLMLVWMHGTVRELVTFNFNGASWENLRAYDFGYSLIFGMDLIFATVGYVMNFRVIDTHIRTAEPTMLGWVVALFCYQPFYGLFERQYVHYDDGFTFASWLAPFPHFRWVWAIAILTLIGIYVLATFAFGIRFSNLTHRGILTNGPYRFTKHPAYVSKNLSWWLISVPFLPHEGPAMALKHCLGIAAVNFMYFMRARTEEKHLSRDPVYVEYALWMNEHGVLRFLGKWLPVFRYKAPLPELLAAEATARTATQPPGG